MAGLDEYTKLLLHLDGADASKVFPDETSSSGKVVTATGTAQLDTAQKQFGTASLLLDGNSDYASTPRCSDFNFSGNFTIEGWVRWNSVPTDFTHAFYSSLGNTKGVSILWDDSTTIRLLYANAAGDGWQINATGTITTMTTGAWYHFALVRNGNVAKVYWNGTEVISSTSASVTPAELGAFIIGGGYQDPIDRFLNGWIDEFRVSNIARYTANFTPSASAFSDDDNTVMLLHFDGDDAATTFIDSATSGKSVTPVADAQVDTAQYKFASGSLLLDGTGDYLSIPDDADWVFSGDFTIDGWVRWGAVPTTYTHLFSSSLKDTNGVSILFDDSTTIRALFGNAAGDGWQFNVTAAITEMTTGAWYHFAYVRSGTTVKVYWQGTAVITQTGISNTPAHTGIFAIGAGYDTTPSRFLNGWIDEFRVSNGIARWTDNFTSPTEPYSIDSAVISTRLLMGVGG